MRPGHGRRIAVHRPCAAPCPRGQYLASSHPDRRDSDRPICHTPRSRWLRNIWCNRGERGQAQRVRAGIVPESGPFPPGPRMASPPARSDWEARGKSGRDAQVWCQRTPETQAQSGPPAEAPWHIPYPGHGASRSLPEAPEPQERAGQGLPQGQDPWPVALLVPSGRRRASPLFSWAGAQPLRVH